MKKAFTLAEVLITLGIIGIVAAMTMPTLLQKYRKQVIISKLQKASSTISQAVMMGNAEFGTNYREPFDANNPDKALEIFNKYYKPYMKLNKIEKGQIGVFAYMNDGTVLYFFRNYRPPASDGWENTYFVVCLTYKACENFNESYAELKKSLGKDRFTLYTNGSIPKYQLMTYGRDEVIKECKEGTGIEACSAVIGGDGWQIKADYPIKL